MNTKGNSQARPTKKYKKRYKHPVITVVKLDPEQVILVACQGGGAFMDLDRRTCHRKFGPNPDCWNSVKGNRYGNQMTGFVRSEPPS